VGDGAKEEDAVSARAHTRDVNITTEHVCVILNDGGHSRRPELPLIISICHLADQHLKLRILPMPLAV
jgi:hypothetical protein